MTEERRPHEPLWILSLTCLTIGMAFASIAFAVPPPDPAELDPLRVRVNAAWRVKVTTGQASFFVSKPAIDERGITVVRPQAAVFGSGDLADERRLTWEEIESVDAQRTHRFGWLVGGLIGAGAGAVAAYSVNAHDADPPVDLILVGTGTALGVIVGALWRPPDQRLYP